MTPFPETAANRTTRPPGSLVIKIEGVTKLYQMGEETIRALRGVGLEIRRNEYLAIMGPSGSGKSTLMNMLGCLDTPTAGHYDFNGKNVAEMVDDELAASHRFRARMFELATTRDAAKELRIYGAGAEVLRRWDEARAAGDAVEERIEARATLLAVLTWLTFAGAMLAALLLVAREAVRGRASTGDVVFALTMVGGVNYGVGGLAHSATWLLDNLKLGRRLVWLEDLAADVPFVELPRAFQRSTQVRGRRRLRRRARLAGSHHDDESGNRTDQRSQARAIHSVLRFESRQILVQEHFRLARTYRSARQRRARNYETRNNVHFVISWFRACLCALVST